LAFFNTWEGDNVGMIERGEHFGFALESRETIGIYGG
jgi:hypothetical protein